MSEYEFATKNGEIVNLNYTRDMSITRDEVSPLIKSAFESLGRQVSIEQVSDEIPEVYLVQIPYKEKNRKVYICAKGTTPGGRDNLMNEQRIQMKAKYFNYCADKRDSGEEAISIGVYKKDDEVIFCAWKLVRSNAASLETPISKQIKISTISKAITTGFAQQDKGKGEYACAFRKEFIYFYLNNYKWIHTGPVSDLMEHLELEEAPEINDINLNDEVIAEEIDLKTCFEITRNPRKNKVFPLNFIVYGAPGTGKTYSMIEYALAIIDNLPVAEFCKNNSDRKSNVERYKRLVKAGQIVFTTFHQNYGYEEFIQGLRPDTNSEKLSFKTVDGVFKSIADLALNDEDDKNYIIIIDEINRANISKVFGELITLIEEDKRWGELNEMSATLQSGQEFAVPNNLYIIGTMNSADKSISLIDAALRRRFDFFEQKPDSTLVSDEVLRSMLENINLSLVEELDSTDLLVGHSYFMNKDESKLCSILNNNIIPLLYEYFYDNRKKVASILADAIKKSNAKVEIEDDKVGRLRVKEV